MKADELKTEIEQTESRITELEAQEIERRQAFETAQEAYVSGKGDLEALHNEQSKLTLVRQAIESLKATGQKLRQAFETQSANERRNRLIKDLVKTANEVEPLVDKYFQSRGEFDELVSKYSERLVSEATDFRTKQREYQSILKQINPPATAEELTRAGLSDEARQFATTERFNRPQPANPEVIGHAEMIQVNKLNRIAQQEQRAQYAAERAKRRDEQEARRKAEQAEQDAIALDSAKWVERQKEQGLPVDMDLWQQARDAALARNPELAEAQAAG